MWSYYGRKTKIVKYYPDSKYDTIIEPFAGTAVYSLYKENWKKNIILVEKYDIIINLWKYLQNATKQDILSLPDIKDKEDITNHSYLSTVEQSLIYFCANRGSAKPYKIAGCWNNWRRNKEIIASNLHKIRHWNLIHGDYNQINNKEATWFIDPPYKFGGHRYEFSNKLIDYSALSKWCINRRGQVIVCENSKASWLPFQPLVSLQGQKHKTMEVIYTH